MSSVINFLFYYCITDLVKCFSFLLFEIFKNCLKYVPNLVLIGLSCLKLLFLKLFMISWNENCNNERLSVRLLDYLKFVIKIHYLKRIGIKKLQILSKYLPVLAIQIRLDFCNLACNMELASSQTSNFAEYAHL